MIMPGARSSPVREFSDVQERRGLLENNIAMLRSYVRRVVGSAQVAEDVLQDVMVAVLSAPASPDDLESFAAWSRGIARNIAAGQRRILRRTGDQLSSEDSPLPASDASDPDITLDSRRLLANMLKNLEEPTVELLVRRYVLGENAKDIALSVAKSPAALRMQLMRARSAMRYARRKSA
jgi:RNA polymerase sigma factor (sigma-70 family)